MHVFMLSCIKHTCFHVFYPFSAYFFPHDKSTLGTQLVITWFGASVGIVPKIWCSANALIGEAGVGSVTLRGESVTVMVCMGVGVGAGLEFNTGMEGGEKLTSLVWVPLSGGRGHNDTITKQDRLDQSSNNS